MATVVATLDSTKATASGGDQRWPPSWCSPALLDIFSMAATLDDPIQWRGDDPRWLPSWHEAAMMDSRWIHQDIVAILDPTKLTAILATRDSYIGCASLSAILRGAPLDPYKR